MTRRPTPPHGLIFNVKKEDLRCFGSSAYIRVMRGADGLWRLSPRGTDQGYVLMISGAPAEALGDSRIKVTDTYRSVGNAIVL